MNGRASLLFLLILGISVGTAFSYEYGLTVTDDTTGVFADTNQLEQNNRATAWFNMQAGPTSDLRLSFFYEYDGVFAEDSSTVLPWRFDLGKTEYAGYRNLGPGRLRYWVGRIEVQDFSARIISGLSDGFKTEYQMGNTSFFLATGYRGLLYKEDANSFIDADDSKLYADDDSYFGPKRMFVASGARFNELLPFHDFGLEGWAQFDLDSGDVKTNTQYIEPFIEGRLGRAFRWRSWAALELGTSDSDMLLAMGAGLRVRYSKPEFNGLLVTWTSLWASGDTTSMAAFSPIKQGSIGTISSLTFSDTAKVGLDVAMTPKRGMSVSLGGAGLFRSSEDAPSDGTLREDASGYYLGTEVSTQGSIRPTSDLLITLWGGVLVPNTSLYVSDTSNRWKIGLSFVFNM
jgi:hypothetical protein